MHALGSCQFVEEVNERLYRENRELKAELARMRPVVEAALNLRFSMPYMEGCKCDVCKFKAACEAYRAFAGKEGE